MTLARQIPAGSLHSILSRSPSDEPASSADRLKEARDYRDEFQKANRQPSASRQTPETSRREPSKPSERSHQPEKSSRRAAQTTDERADHQHLKTSDLPAKMTSLEEHSRAQASEKPSVDIPEDATSVVDENEATPLKNAMTKILARIQQALQSQPSQSNSVSASNETSPQGAVPEGLQRVFENILNQTQPDAASSPAKNVEQVIAALTAIITSTQPRQNESSSKQLASDDNSDSSEISPDTQSSGLQQIAALLNLLNPAEPAKTHSPQGTASAPHSSNQGEHASVTGPVTQPALFNATTGTAPHPETATLEVALSKTPVNQAKESTDVKADTLRQDQPINTPSNTTSSRPGGAQSVASTASQNVGTRQAAAMDLVQHVANTISQAGSPQEVLKINMHLPEHGELQIDISTHRGAITAVIQTEQPATHKLLLEHLHLLKESLQMQGHTVDRIQIELPQKDSMFGDHQGQQNLQHHEQYQQQQQQRENFATDLGFNPLERQPARPQSTISSVPVKPITSPDQLDIAV